MRPHASWLRRAEIQREVQAKERALMQGLSTHLQHALSLTSSPQAQLARMRMLNTPPASPSLRPPSRGTSRPGSPLGRQRSIFRADVQREPGRPGQRMPLCL